MASGLAPIPWQRRPGSSIEATTSLVTGSIRWTAGSVPSFINGPSTAITHRDPKASMGKSGPPPSGTVAMSRPPRGSRAAGWLTDGVTVGTSEVAEGVWTGVVAAGDGVWAGVGAAAGGSGWAAHALAKSASNTTTPREPMLECHIPGTSDG